MTNILKYQNPSSPLLPAAIKIGYTYKPDISRSTEVEGATPIMDSQELSKKEKRGLYEAYDFYANDVYPRKQKYNGSYNPKIHNMDNLTKRVIFREPLNFKNGFNRGGYAPIYLPSESSQIPNFLTPIVTRKPRDFGNTVLHEATHAEDGDSFKTDNFKLGESMTDEEAKLLDEAYKFEYEDDMTRAEKQTTNREFRFGLSRLTGLYLDDLTDYINNLSTKELKKLYKKINPGYKELMIRPKYDDSWGDAVKKALIQVGQNTTDPNHIDYRDPVTFAKKGGHIHIKKKNRGKFTEYCGGKVTEECITKGKNSKDPKIRKRATFAANARKWKHENGGILKAQEGTTEGFWSKLWNAVKEGGMAARDAKLGAVGAQQVRDLYAEGKNQEAQDLAKQYAKANTTGIALAGGAASTGLLGDLMVTGATTAADTFIDGDTENFGKSLVKNTAGDLIGHGVFKGLRYFNGKPIFVKEMKNGIGDGLYHLDYGDAKGAFKSGSYIKNGYLYPGKTDLDGQLDYIWFNESKPYATAVHGKKPFSRTIIFDQKDIPGILRVREQNYPIGQWNGKSGFVTKHEMVTSNPIDMDNATVYKRIPIFNTWLRTK